MAHHLYRFLRATRRHGTAMSKTADAVQIQGHARGEAYFKMIKYGNSTKELMFVWTK